MKRLSVLLLIGLATSANADESGCKAWFKFLKGDWKYEVKEVNLKGTVSFRIVSKGNAMIARYRDANGLVGNELTGWRSDKKVMVASGFGSAGNHWRMEIGKVTANGFTGTNSGVLPDGRKYDVKVVGKKIDENNYQWTFDGKTGDGKAFKASGKYTRRTRQ